MPKIPPNAAVLELIEKDAKKGKKEVIELSTQQIANGHGKKVLDSFDSQKSEKAKKDD